MIHWEREAREQRDHDAAAPGRALAVRADRALDDRVSDLVLHLDVANHRPARRSVSRSRLRRTRTHDVMKNWFSM
jgi:hypothetical protein